MERFFLDFFNRSIVAGWMILAVILLRLLLKRAPKWIHCLLWGMVAVRLAFPFSLESIFSLIPSRETVQHTTAVPGGTMIDSGIRFVDNAVNPVIWESAAPTPAASVDPLQIWLFSASVVWIAGAGVLLLNAVVSCIRLWLKIRTAVRLEGRVMTSEFVDTPFIFGVFRPRIYLPSGMSEELRVPVVAHELAHLRRRDNLWKVTGYTLLALYWFHPLCWAAYILFCRDIELACDESVIRKYDMHQKKVYSEALLACSQGRRAALVCPLAFGEVGVKARIRSVLHYKKPAFWAMTAALVACVIAAVCFMTDPVKGEQGSGDAMSANSAGGGSGSRLESGDDEGGDEPADSGSEIAGSSESGEGEGAVSGQDAKQAALRETLVSEWAAAFVNRDGNVLETRMTEALAAEMLEGPKGERSFGFSSPWPRDEEKDACILYIGEESAEIQYYAWTSDPHVTAWRERISYELQDGKYVVTGEELFWLDDISTSEVFGMAYGDCPIDGSPMDYGSNGAGKNLSDNALLSSTMRYDSLFKPESAAVDLLNLSDDPSKVKIERLYEESGSVNLEITFPEDEDGLPVRITMEQLPSGHGIWIPKSYRVDPLARLMNADWSEIRRRNLHVSDRPIYEWSNDISCIAELPEENIRIYGYGDAECWGQGVAIEIGEDVNYFDWTYTSSHGVLPDCYWDARSRQLQVAMRIYTGTGASAQELHVLQYHDTGTLTDNVLEISDYWDLLGERIDFTFDEETGLLTLFDTRNNKDLMTMEAGEEKVEGLELGNISDFRLGETIWLSLEPGYFPEGWAIAEYSESGIKLEAELIMLESQGQIRFALGEIRAVE